jgi:uncharacterized protein YgbK (DUF1537 family)
MNRIFIVADDLTGANDTAVQYHAQGFRTVVRVIHDASQLQPMAAAFDVIAINAGTRAMLPEKAYQVNFGIVRDLAGLEPAYLYKKMDSLLRGCPAAELDAVMAASGKTLSLIAPSFPENGRTMLGGVIYDKQKPAAQALDLFKINLHRKVGLVDHAMLQAGETAVHQDIQRLCAEGCQVVLLDAATRQDLSLLAKIGWDMRKQAILGGSAGFARTLAAHERSGSAIRQGQRAAEGVTLIVLGTTRQETARQVERILDQAVCLTVPVDLILREEPGLLDRYTALASDQFSKGDNTLILALDSLFRNADQQEEASNRQAADACQIIRFLGAWTRRMFECRKVGTVIASGGDTAQEICRVLQVGQIEFIDEVCSGVPVCLAAAWSGKQFWLISKSGGFGGEDALRTALRSIQDTKANAGDI